MKRGLKVFIFILISVVSFVRITHIFNWKSSADIDTFNCEHFYGTPAQTIDVLFVGSSHCFCSINNAVLWDNYGIAGYNFSTGCQNLANSYYYIKEAFKTQSPKVVCVEALYFNQSGYNSSGDVYRNTLGLNYSKDYVDNIEETVRIYGEEGGTETDLFFKWPIIHSRYTDLTQLDYDDYLYFQRGYRVSFESKEFEQPEATYNEELADVNAEAYYYIDKIIELVQENNSDIIFFAAPYNVDNNKMAEFNTLEVYLKNIDVEFINFNKCSNPANIDYSTDIWDGSHLNYYGACKVSDYMGSYLKDKYTFENHEGDDRYVLWELDKAYYDKLLYNEMGVNNN